MATSVSLANYTFGKTETKKGGSVKWMTVLRAEMERERGCIWWENTTGVPFFYRAPSAESLRIMHGNEGAQFGKVDFKMQQQNAIENLLRKRENLIRDPFKHHFLLFKWSCLNLPLAWHRIQYPSLILTTCKGNGRAVISDLRVVAGFALGIYEALCLMFILYEVVWSKGFQGPLMLNLENVLKRLLWKQQWMLGAQPLVLGSSIALFSPLVGKFGWGIRNPILFDYLCICVCLFICWVKLDFIIDVS